MNGAAIKGGQDVTDTDMCHRVTRHHRVRDLFLTVLLVAIISVIVTFHTTDVLASWGTSDRDDATAGWKLHFKGHVEIYRRVDVAKESLEGIDLRNGARPPVRGEKGRVNGRRRVPHTLSDKLKRIEADLLSTSPDQTSTVQKVSVILQCTPGNPTREGVTIYRKALQKAGYSIIQLPASEALGKVSYIGDANATTDRRLLPSEWTLIFYEGDTAIRDGLNCAESGDLASRLRPSQKLNQIPVLASTLSSRDSFCETMTKYKHIPVFRESPVSPVCFRFPEQSRQFLSAVEHPRERSKWLVTELHSEHRQKVIDATHTKYILGMTQPSVIQQCMTSPLLLYGRPFTVQAYVLVISFSPLRAYVHLDGVVKHMYGYGQQLRKADGEIWTFEQLDQYMSRTYDREISRVLFKNMNSAIVQTLLLADDYSKLKDEHRCENCFQLLSFELMFNSSLHPSVLQVVAQPDLVQVTKVNIWDKMVVRSRNMADDIVSMLSATTSVSMEVAMALAELNRDVSIAELGCQPLHKVCLTESEAQYLLAWRKELMHRGRFQQIYPTAESDKYSQLLDSFDTLSPPDQMPSSGETRQRSTCKTAQFHAVLVGVAKFYQALDSVDESYDDLNIPWYPEVQQNPHNTDSSQKLLENIFYNTSHLEDKYIRQSCSKDRQQMPYLQAFHTEPSLHNISPEFNPKVTEYYASVPYDVFLIKVWAFAANCYSEARFETKYGLARPSNYTLGLGRNRISIVVVDLTHTQPWLINTYIIYIQRKGHVTGGNQSETGKPLRVCRLLQDCELPYIPSAPCGLQPSGYASWQQYMHHADTLPQCTSADVTGEWLVPCTKCTANASCQWSMAKWQPEYCTHPKLKRDQLRKCLAGKQLLFIGDSTNRGMMHYLMEQVNATLTEWDKTHNSRVYTNINAQRTTVSFSYYPQFWLSANQRPVFDKALYQLMKLSLPLENNHNTVLVVGGVHWLASHHLAVIKKALHKEHLDGIKLIVKGLGAGFHQPVDGLHCLSLQEQRKLLIHNAGLVDYARRNAFRVIETFNMTMSRYKDFLQGKCACHFHRVKGTLPSFTDYMRKNALGKGKRPLTDTPIHYHVEGDINAVYSELLLNSICTYS